MMNNKIAKGIVSLTIIVVLLLSVLAGSFYYQNNITANVVKEDLTNFNKDISIKEIDAKNLNQLNEGWYKTINGNLFYLERFDKPVYLYARIDNPEYKNEIFSVDADGNLEFFGNNSLNNGNNKLKSTSNNQISGNVVGMESVSGMQSAAPPAKTPAQISWENIQAIGGLTRNDDGTYSKQGYLGKFNVKLDGSIYYDAIGDNTRVRQTFTNGKWWSIDGKELNQIPITTQTPAAASPASSPTEVGPNPPPQILEEAFTEDKLWVEVKGGNVYEVYRDGDKYYYKGTTTYVDSKVLSGYVSTTSQGLTVQKAGSTPIASPAATGGSLTPGPATPVPANSIPANYDNWIQQYSGANGLNPNLVKAMIQAESNFDPTATSPKGAQGLMQIMPGTFAETARELGLTNADPNDPETNIRVGTAYYKKLLNQYGGNEDEALAAYNAGPDNVNKGIIPDETRSYIGSVRLAMISASSATQAPKPTFTFQVTDNLGNKIGDPITISADSKILAQQELQKGYPSAYYKIQDVGSVQLSQVGIQSAEVGMNKDKILLTYNGKYMGTFDKDSEPLTTITDELESYESFKVRNKNLGLTDAQLWEAYFKTGDYGDLAAAQDIISKLGVRLAPGTIPGTAAGPTAEQLKLPQQLQNENGPVDAWRMPDGRLTYDKNEVDKFVQQVYVNQALGKLPGGRLYAVDTLTGIQLAQKDNQLYRFDVNSKEFVKLQPTDTFTLTQKVGGKDYPITYDYNNGKPTAREITLADNTKASISDNQLNFIKNYPGSGQLSKSGNTLKYSFTSSKKVGDNEQTLTTNVEFFAKGPTETKTTQVKDKNNNILSLKETTNEYYEETTIATGEKRYVFGLSSQKNYKLGEGETSINPDTSDYTQITTDPATGQPTKLTMREKRIESSAQYVNGQVTGSGKAKDRLSTEISQYKSRQFFAGFQFIFTEFRGIGYIPSLFGFNDDNLIEWRNTVDKYFSPFLGTEYWQSKICTATAGLATENEGIAYAETPQGLAQIGAHIEATRTQPIVTENGTSYIYKITFQVRNGDYDKDPRAPENMSINVFIIPNGQGISSGIKIFKQDIHIGRGSTFGRFGTNAIVQESTNLYDKICIKFLDEIPLKWKIKDKILCNKIEDNTYSQPTALQQRNTAQRGTNTDMNNW